MSDEKTDEAIKNLEAFLGQQDGKEKQNFSPLMTATLLGKKEMAEMLIDSGADVNQKCAGGFTALHLAAICEKTELVRLLVERGADVNIASNNGYLPIIFAMYKNNSEIVKILLDSGANVNIPLNNEVKKEKRTFNQVLSDYISAFTLKGLGKPSLIYKRTEVSDGTYALSKQTFAKIRNASGKNYHPQKKNVFLLAFGMELTLSQTEDLLASAGYAFDPNSKFDMVVKRFIERRDFKMGKLEDALYKEAGETFCKYD